MAETLQTFVKDNLGGFARQCVALADEARAAAGQAPIIGNASTWLKAPGFVKYTGQAIPKGDILVFKPGVGGISQQGHVGIDLGKVGNMFSVFGANQGIGSNENAGLAPSIMNIAASDVAGFVPETWKGGAKATKARANPAEKFWLVDPSNPGASRLVTVHGLTQTQLNSLHERLQKILSAGGVITSIKQNSNGSVSIFGTVPQRLKNSIDNFLVGWAIDPHLPGGFFGATWFKSGKTTPIKSATKAPPSSPSDVLAAAVKPLAPVGAFFAQLGSWITYAKAHPWIIILAVIMLFLVLASVKGLASDSGIKAMPVPVPV